MIEHTFAMPPTWPKTYSTNSQNNSSKKRLLGRGKTQQQAINEVIAFDERDPRRSSILKLLANWKISIEIMGQVSEEKELMMALSQAYLEWEQKTEQRGLEKGLQQGVAQGEQSSSCAF
jgi:hypothetical protein